MQNSNLKSVIAYSMNSEVIGHIEESAKRIGVSRSAFVEKILSDSLGIYPQEDRADIALAAARHSNISKVIQMNPIIYEKLITRCEKYNKKLSPVVNRLLLDALDMSFEELR